jgi:NADH-quinone oxidoreductase subunit C
MSDPLTLERLEVAPADWVAAVTEARDAAYTFFDFLTAVDQSDAEEAPGLDLVCHLMNPSTPNALRRIMVRTRVPDGASIASLTGVFRGAAWHERETHEMFGIGFDGHPDLRPLLLPDGFEGRPLRKDFVLAARVAKPFPGAKEPGESDREAAPGRRRTLPPGVPDPGTWGPRPPGGSPAPSPGTEEQGAGETP